MNLFHFGGKGSMGGGHRRRRRFRGGEVTLADVPPGEVFSILRIRASGEFRQRLIDLGFIRGATGRVMREALLRDPIELELAGCRISLRRAEAGDIIVEVIR